MSIPAHTLRSAREEDTSFEVPPLSPEEEKSLDEAIKACRDNGCKGRVMSLDELLFDEE